MCIHDKLHPVGYSSIHFHPLAATAQRGNKKNRFSSGDRADLLVDLPKGYRAGDLVHVALPACMSWIKGGGRVRRFTMDFRGEDELRVPVVVTGELRGKQHFAVCVRNILEEERATSPGLPTVQAQIKGERHL